MRSLSSPGNFGLLWPELPWDRSARLSMMLDLGSPNVGHSYPLVFDKEGGTNCHS